MGATKNLVLGGSGMIGTALCHFLKGKGESVTNLDLENGHDLRIMNLDEYSNHDFVWFLAWDVGGAKYLSDKSNQHSLMYNNIKICENVFSFLGKHQLPFLFSSSQLAAPDNSYGVTKLMAEHWTSLLGGYCVRFWNVYGWETPGIKSHVIPDLIMQALTQGKISLMTTGEEERQFIYMDDCVRQLDLIRSGSNKDVHLTNGEWIKIRTIAEMIGEKLKAAVSVGDTIGYSNKIDPHPSYRDFNWNTSLSTGLDQLIEFAKNHIRK